MRSRTGNRGSKAARNVAQHIPFKTLTRRGEATRARQDLNPVKVRAKSHIMPRNQLITTLIAIGGARGERIRAEP
jgi:hypothetical protein